MHAAHVRLRHSLRHRRKLVNARFGAAIMAATVATGVIAGASPALAEGLVADISIRSVRLTDRDVLRIEADYVCPPGFSVPPSFLPRAYASQQSDIGGSSQYKKFGDIVCDGIRHDVLVRFVRPRHPQGGRWAPDALTQVSLTFRATQTDTPYLTVSPSDVQMVITRTAAHAELVADIEVRRVKLSARGALRVRAATLCPVGLAVKDTLPPTASVRQDTAIPRMSHKVFAGIVCDGVLHNVVVRFAHPRRPSTAGWEASALTHVSLTFQASTESPFRYVLATDTESEIA
jgi:hypothetical protein